MLGHQVTLNGGGEARRALNTGAAAQRRVRFHLEDVAVLAVERSGQIIKLLLRIGAQN